MHIKTLNCQLAIVDGNKEQHSYHMLSLLLFDLVNLYFLCPLSVQVGLF